MPQLFAIVALLFLFGWVTVPGHAVTGTVSAVDVPSAIITLKSGNATLRLDLSNPSLRGYRTLESIRRGDRVQVAYVPSGVRISRLPATGGPGNKAIREPAEPAPQPKKKASKVARARVRGTDFDDVDENKDGRISPVELSVAIKDLTIEKFRQYDRNRDGYLDRTEFASVPR